MSCTRRAHSCTHAATVFILRRVVRYLLVIIHVNNAVKMSRRVLHLHAECDCRLHPYYECSPPSFRNQCMLARHARFLVCWRTLIALLAEREKASLFGPARCFWTVGKKLGAFNKYTSAQKNREALGRASSAKVFLVNQFLKHLISHQQTQYGGGSLSAHKFNSYLTMNV